MCVVCISRKVSLIWEVVQIRRNAEAYNEEGSLIIRHSRILANTLCRFIASTSSDPLLFYREEGEEEEGGIGEGVEGEVGEGET